MGVHLHMQTQRQMPVFGELSIPFQLGIYEYKEIFGKNNRKH